MEEKTIKVASVSAILIYWLAIIGVGVYSERSIKVASIVGIILSIIALGFIFGRQILAITEKLRESEGEPEPLNEEQIEIRENKEIEKMWNYIIKGVPFERKSANINGNIIYVSVRRLVYEMDFGGEKTNEIIIITNATYPEIRSTIIPRNVPDEKIIEDVNKMSRSPMDASIEEVESGIDTFGRPTQRIKRVNYKKKEKEEDTVE